MIKPLLAFMAAVSCASVARAQLLIAPTTVEFAGTKRSAAIEITNQADTPAALQFRAFSWQQKDGHDALDPTEDLAISPPIATLPPHGKQVFRVLDLAGGGKALNDTERNYRLLLNQLPDPGTSAIRINIEFSLPVFMTPKEANAAPVWRVGADAVSVTNTGTRRMRLQELAIRSPGGELTLLATTGSPYLLAGARRVIPFPLTVRIKPGSHLVGSSDAGQIDEPLLVLAAR